MRLEVACIVLSLFLIGGSPLFSWDLYFYTQVPSYPSRSVELGCKDGYDPSGLGRVKVGLYFFLYRGLLYFLLRTLI